MQALLARSGPSRRAYFARWQKATKGKLWTKMMRRAGAISQSSSVGSRFLRRLEGRNDQAMLFGQFDPFGERGVGLDFEIFLERLGAQDGGPGLGHGLLLVGASRKAWTRLAILMRLAMS